ncbi:MAG: hypothetical protein OEZ36_08710, partial [Spirochaetota bacterium]|nr:hypothetical protein [Spirochaetota bacterium]
FVFKREDYPKYVLGDVCLGIAWVGRALLANLFIHSKKFYEFKKLHLTFHIGNSLTWRNNDFEDYTTHNKSIFDLIISQAENERKSFSKNEMSYLTDIGPKRYQPFDQDIDSLTDSGDKK